MASRNYTSSSGVNAAATLSALTGHLDANGGSDDCTWRVYNGPRCLDVALSPAFEGKRKNPFALRRAAAIQNLETIQRMSS